MTSRRRLSGAADTDKREWVVRLLDHGADIERRNQEYGSTPLICAVIWRQKRIIRTLVQRGADATGQPLHVAVLNRDIEMTRVLMDLGADARQGIWPHRDATTAYTNGFDGEMSHRLLRAT